MLFIQWLQNKQVFYNLQLCLNKEGSHFISPHLNPHYIIGLLLLGNRMFQLDNNVITYKNYTYINLKKLTSTQRIVFITADRKHVGTKTLLKLNFKVASIIIIGSLIQIYICSYCSINNKNRKLSLTATLMKWFKISLCYVSTQFMNMIF